MEEEKINVYAKPRGETVYAYVNEYKGTKYLHIREWYLDKDGKEMPTKKGVTFPMDKIEALRDAINQLLLAEQPAK